jgi:hypothetical protein
MGCPGVPGVCTTIVRNTGHFVQQSANFVASVGLVSVEATAGTSNGMWIVRTRLGNGHLRAELLIRRPRRRRSRRSLPAC